MKCNDFNTCSAVASNQCSHNQSDCLEPAGAVSYIVCKEKGKSYTLDNNSSKVFVKKYHIDGGPLVNGEKRRCDYLLVIQNNSSSMIFVELKGANVEDAAEQIVTTYEILKSQISSNKLYARIVHAGAVLRAHNGKWYYKLKKIFTNKCIEKHEFKLSEKVENF